MTKTEVFNQQQYQACPCNYCNANPGCTNQDCILYAAYERGESVPRSLIDHMNRARVQ